MRMSRLVVFALSGLALAASARAAETLRVLALDSEPFFYQKDGKLAGIEYDILDYFAKSRGATLQVEWVESFAGILERVAGGIAPSCAVAVVRQGKPVWAEGFGIADLERGRKATADSIYVLASVSKPITCAWAGPRRSLAQNASRSSTRP